MVESIHIVRRYGSVGGMEHYVRQLTLELIGKSCAVTVVCEKSYISSEEKSNTSKLLTVVELGEKFRKPRWLGQWYFSQRVSDYLRCNNTENVVVHSHERSALHHVTTFHGPPFLNRKKRLLDCFSPRIHMWEFLEKRELMASRVKAILPNSELIAAQLKNFYPQVGDKVLSPALPGVDPLYESMLRTTQSKTIGFLGREWKRKGLEKACRIVEAIREIDPEVNFLVAGCEPQEIQYLFRDWPKESYTLAGWVKPQDFYGNVSVLLHPAKAEPFGMVVAEANAVGIPVIVSDQCGVAGLLQASQGHVFGLQDVNELWAKACLECLNDESDVPSLSLTWSALADQHISLYQSIKL